MVGGQSVEIGDDGGGIQNDPMVWVSDRKEIATFLADAASGEVAEAKLAVGGVVYIFDQEERGEKLKAAVSSLGLTDASDSRRAKLDALKEISSVRPRGGPASRADVVCRRAGGSECQNSAPTDIYHSIRTAREGRAAAKYSRSFYRS